MNSKAARVSGELSIIGPSNRHLDVRLGGTLTDLSVRVSPAALAFRPNRATLLRIGRDLERRGVRVTVSTGEATVLRLGERDRPVRRYPAGLAWAVISSPFVYLSALLAGAFRGR